MKKQIDRIVMWMATSTNAWLVLMGLNVALALFFGSLAIFLEQSRWVALFQMGFCGWNIAQAVYARQSMQARHAFYEMRAAFNAMHELNNDLVTGQFEAMIVRRRIDGDDDAPIAPNRMN